MNGESLTSTRGGLPATLRAWRASLVRTFVQPRSTTLLTLAPEEVARRLKDAPLDEHLKS